MKKIRALIVDDSKLIQSVLLKILNSDPNIEVIGCADDPFIARDLIKLHNPDVLTLDIMMPNMDGLTFLKNLMRLRPMPVVMISSLTQKNSVYSIEALALGAIDFIPKPSLEDFKSKDYAKLVIDIVKNAAATNILTSASIGHLNHSQKTQFDKFNLQPHVLKRDIIAIGASTGGVEALETILSPLPKVFPPIVVVQHIKKEFSVAFSERINKLCHLSVLQAKHNALLLPGNVYMAPPESHTIVEKSSQGYVIKLKNEPPIGCHRPSIDVLFQSVAKAAAKHTIGVLLTGMGADGAQGLKAIHDAGGATIAQDKESSVVWGMPGSAVKLKAVDFIVSLPDITLKIMQLLDKKALAMPMDAS